MIYRSTQNVLQLINAEKRYRILPKIQLICMHITIKYVVGVK